MRRVSEHRGYMLIGGRLVESSSRKWISSVNPATEGEIGEFPEGTAADVSDAARAAVAAAPAWAALSVDERGDYLRSLARAVEARMDEIIEIEVADTGNTAQALHGDLVSAIWSLNHYAGLGYELKGETIPATAAGLHLTVREPWGVVGRIVPFNHPFMFATARTAAALMAGNSVILKPPETSSLSATIYAQICGDVLPAGVMNIVTGYGHPVGDAIAREPRIRRIAFIGSPQTGMAIQRAAAESCVKSISLELGGKNPMIVFPDADFEAATVAAVRGMNFSWQGQSCGSTSRLLVHESLYDKMVEHVGAAVRSIKVGPPDDKTSGMGPMNSRAQADKVLSYMAIAKKEGARVVAGGGVPEGVQYAKGFWVQPTVFSDVTQNMRIANEEVFGPILSIMKWKSEDEAVTIANAVEYGLTAAIWTRDIGRALRMARRLQSGYQWINGVGTHYRGVPFGGFKNSGIGREESIEEMLSYTQQKTISVPA